MFGIKPRNVGDERDEQDPRWQRLEGPLWDYVRAGWTVTQRTANQVRLEKNAEHVTLSLGPDDKIVIDGPALTGFQFDGRMRAWFFLIVLLVSIFGAAGLLGFFR